MDHSVLIVGAGTAGLMAARLLSGAGIPVVLLEAMERPGGRIHSVQPAGFSEMVEAGAEFVHGKLPLSLQLLKEAGITRKTVKGETLNVRQGEWANAFDAGWDFLIKKMESLQQDMPIAEFLSTYITGEEHASLRQAVKGFAQGYDLADLNTASTLALYKEWQHEGEGDFRPAGGYDRLVEFLLASCRANGCHVHFGRPVTAIRWEKGKVEAETAGGQVFTASKIIVTVSLGMLQRSFRVGEAEGIRFNPRIDPQLQAAAQMGFGSVIKILMIFTERFWEKAEGLTGKKIGFILSDEAVPTWWTPASHQVPLLTGWLAGDKMKTFQGLDEQGRIDSCLRSLAAVFKMDIFDLRDKLVNCLIVDWAEIPYIRGGYSFDTIHSHQARQILLTPVADTIYFAGEALYEGPSPGTVEASLTSGKEVASRILGA